MRLARVVIIYDARCMILMSKSAIGHVGVQATICNITAFLHGHTKIASDDKSKQLFTQKNCLIGNKDP